MTQHCEHGPMKYKGSDRGGLGMTQREKLLALLAEFDIEAEEEDDEYGYDLVLEAKHGGVNGYTGFFVRFSFDETGKFLGVGVWE